MRPCNCDRYDPDPTAAFTTIQCRLCWLYAHDPIYRAFWDGKPGSGDLSHCIHRGAETGQSVPCQSCHGTVALKLFACAVHGSCTLVRADSGHACCTTCPDRNPPDPGEERPRQT